mmetsp:Transcript_5349/g.22087  ORF Transcript_5349/g.22087 Transcript_5349/m.22087 type:complete len:297 (+) Transcript_5349:97-987(+)
MPLLPPTGCSIAGIGSRQGGNPEGGGARSAPPPTGCSTARCGYHGITGGRRGSRLLDPQTDTDTAPPPSCPRTTGGRPAAACAGGGGGAGGCCGDTVPPPPSGGSTPTPGDAALSRGRGVVWAARAARDTPGPSTAAAGAAAAGAGSAVVAGEANVSSRCWGARGCRHRHRSHGLSTTVPEPPKEHGVRAHARHSPHLSRRTHASHVPHRRRTDRRRRGPDFVVVATVLSRTVLGAGHTRAAVALVGNGVARSAASDQQRSRRSATSGCDRTRLASRTSHASRSSSPLSDAASHHH